MGLINVMEDIRTKAERVITLLEKGKLSDADITSAQMQLNTIKEVANSMITTTLPGMMEQLGKVK